MIKTVLKIAAAFALSALLWLGLVHLLYNDSYSSLAALFYAIGIDPFSGEPSALICLALVCMLVFATLAQLFFNRLWMPFFTAEAALYALALFVVVFGKSQGIQEWNLDPTDIFSQVAQYPTSVMLNIAIFIPMGLIAHCRVKRTGMAFLVALVGILAIEAIQYLFALGIADVVDVIMNMMGFAIGYLTMQLLYDQGFLLTRVEGRPFRRFEKTTLHRGNESQALSKRSAIALAALVGIACFGFVLIYTFYDYNSYVEWDDSPQPTEDAILSELPLSATTAAETRKAIEGIDVFTFDAVTPSNAWIDVDGNSLLSVQGGITETYSWITDSNETRHAVTLSIEERVGTVTLTHVLPLVIDETSCITMDGSAVDTADQAALEEAIDAASLRTAHVTFSIQDGWLHTETLEFVTSEDAPTPDRGIDYSSYTNELGQVTTSESKHYRFPLNEAQTLNAYAYSYCEIENEEPYLTIKLNDSLGSALIGHSINVACTTQPATFGDNDEPSTITVLLDSQGLRLIE